MPSAWEGQSVKITEQGESVFISASRIMYLWRLLAFLSPASSKRKGVGTVESLMTLRHCAELNRQTKAMQPTRVSVCHTFFSQGFSDVCIPEFLQHTAVHNRPVSPHYKGHPRNTILIITYWNTGNIHFKGWEPFAIVGVSAVCYVHQSSHIPEERANRPSAKAGAS